MISPALFSRDSDEWRTPPALWRRVPGYEDRYIVSDGGVVCSLRRNGAHLRQKIRTKNGYTRPEVGLFGDDGKQRWFTVAKVVMLAFVGPRPEGMEIDHIDGNPTNNCLSNLRYVTHLDNIHYSIESGKHPAAYGGRGVKIVGVDRDGRKYLFPSAAEVERRGYASKSEVWSMCNGRRRQGKALAFRYFSPDEDSIDSFFKVYERDTSRPLRRHTPVRQWVCSGIADTLCGWARRFGLPEWQMRRRAKRDGGVVEAVSRLRMELVEGVPLDARALR